MAVTHPWAQLAPPVGGAVTPAVGNALTFTPAIGDLTLGLQVLPPGTYDRMIARIDTPNAQALVRGAVYAATVGGFGSLLVDTGQVAGTGGGYLAMSISGNLVISGSPTAVWAGLVNQGAATASFWAAQQGYGLLRITDNGNGIDLGGYYPPASIVVSGTTGAIPSSPTITSWDGDRAPRIAFRRATGTPVIHSAANTVILTQTAYDALGTPDANTLYVISGP